jgi:hypothetical protein
MQWGISLKISSDFDKDLWGLPTPSKMTWITKMNDTRSLKISYHFQYSPQSWREWQRVSSIKVQIERRIANVEFEEYDSNSMDGHVYTITELGKHFSDYVKYQKPLYPIDKSEFMRSLTIYAKRLHYENMMHIEAVIAMALHFNNKCGFGYSMREINRKARAIFELDRDEWRVKLPEDAVREKKREGAYKTAQIKRDKSQQTRDEVIALRNDGLTLQSISDRLCISLSTVRRYIAQYGACDHIDKS